MDVHELADRPRFIVSRDGLTTGYQLSVESGGLGYRIAGPKFCGRSVELMVASLDEGTAKEIVWHLCRSYPNLAHDYAAKHPIEAKKGGA